MDRDEHYAAGEKALREAEDWLSPEGKAARAQVAQAHFLAALAAQPPLRLVNPGSDPGAVLSWGGGS